MSLSAAMVSAFVDEAKKHGSVWAVRDSGGYPAPKNAEGERAMPFWSSKSRVQKIIDTVPAYRAFEAEQIELEPWLNKWLPDLESDGLKIGLNWYGKRVTGWHLSGTDVRAKFGLPASSEGAQPVEERGHEAPVSRIARFAAWFGLKASTR